MIKSEGSALLHEEHGLAVVLAAAQADTVRALRLAAATAPGEGLRCQGVVRATGAGASLGFAFLWYSHDIVSLALRAWALFNIGTNKADVVHSIQISIGH